MIQKNGMLMIKFFLGSNKTFTIQKHIIAFNPNAFQYVGKTDNNNLFTTIDFIILSLVIGEIPTKKNKLRQLIPKGAQFQTI
jgi:hypothetical protein